MKDINEIRLDNLKFLHGRATINGGPTSDNLATFFSKQGVDIGTKILSDIYWRKKSIDDALAEKIETAFGLPAGWLSVDQSYWLTISQSDFEAIKSFTRLPDEVRSSLFVIINSILNQKQSHKN